jgi:ligand-binding sensor domain-containing protein
MFQKMVALILCFCVCYGTALAQDIQLINTSNSKLPEDNLWSIAIDHNGNKWIGAAHSGLVKYDGQNFTVYDKNNSPISDNFISSIYVDQKNNVWVPQKNGVARFNGTSWTMYDGSVSPLLNKDLYKIKEGPDGKLYFGYWEGIITFDGSVWKKLDLPGDHPYDVLDLDVSKNGQIAVGCDICLLLCDGDKWRTLVENNSELQLGTVRSVKYMDDGSLYIGYGGGFGKGGFSILNNGAWKHFNKNNSALPDQMVRDIKVTGKGVIWMATNDGLAEIENGNIKALKFWPGRFANAILGIAIDKDGSVWAVTPRGLVHVK